MLLLLLVGEGVFDAFVFGSPVLKPDFDLRFAEAECGCQFGPSRGTDVFPGLVFHLQVECLVRGEGRSLTASDPGLATASLQSHCK